MVMVVRHSDYCICMTRVLRVRVRVVLRARIRVKVKVLRVGLGLWAFAWLMVCDMRRKWIYVLFLFVIWWFLGFVLLGGGVLPPSFGLFVFQHPKWRSVSCEVGKGSEYSNLLYILIMDKSVDFPVCSSELLLWPWADGKQQELLVRLKKDAKKVAEEIRPW